MNKKDNYSPISVINCEQIMKLGYPKLTTFSLIMSKKLKNSPFEFRKYYQIKSSCGIKEDCENYILLKSDFETTADEEEKVCLSAKNMDQNQINRHQNHYKERYVGQQFGIVPTIPYNCVSNIAKTTGNSYYNSNGISYEEYILGYYPKKIIDFDFKYSNFIMGDTYSDILAPYGYTFNKESFSITKDKFSLPSIIDDKLVIEDYSVYYAITSKDEEIKAIKYNGEWFSIEPVKWIKIGDNLVCEGVLFESPVHMKNEYVKNDDIQSLDDTFIKWYIDNIFTKDLFKYINCTYMREQIPIRMDEEIDSKLKEIERLKQLKANLILQQQGEEHIIDTAHRNITRLFEEDTKEQVVKTLHK